MPKILLAGMNRPSNQFTRFLESRGCQVVHISGDPGGSIPTECDAVIITKSQISHEKFWKTKDLYKDLDKPVFITDFSVSPIKDRLEQFIAKFKSDKTKNMPTYMKTNELADKIIETDWADNVSIKETMLKLKDMRQPNGDTYSIHYITTVRGRMGLKPAKPAPTPVKAKEPERKVEPVAPQKTISVDKAELVMRILLTPVSTSEKAELIMQVLMGKAAEHSVVVRKSKRGLEFLVVNPISQVESPLLTLSQTQAVAIVQHISEVEDFATDPSV